MVLGEGEILRQVKSALESAAEVGTLRAHLNELFQRHAGVKTTSYDVRRIYFQGAQIRSSVIEEVRRAAYEIIQRKGATNHAIGLVTADLVRSILRDERRVLTVSRVQDGIKGLEDVAISLPAIVGREGAVEIVEPEMDEKESQAFARSAQVLREALGSVQ